MNVYLQHLSNVPPGRVFALDGQTLIAIGFNLFNATVLAVALVFILYKPVTNFLRHRTQKIQHQFDRAAEDMRAAEELRAQYEEKLEAILTERDMILESARKHAAENSQQIISEAKSSADALRERAEVDIKLAREQAKEDVRQSILEVSAAMTEKYLVHAMDYDTQERLLDETLAELEELTWQR